MELKPFSIGSLAMHEAIIVPTFADLLPNEMPDTARLHEFSMMDNVVTKRPILDIKGIRNIGQRRSASCDTNYRKVMGVTTRSIATEELEFATKHCANEFYTGALREWRNQDPLFTANLIEKFFKQAVGADMFSNAYFGDTSRAYVSTSTWSYTLFDGVFTWIKKYIAAGVITSTSGTGQAFSIPAATNLITTPATAYSIIEQLYQRQNPLMKSFPASQKAFYVSQSIIDGYVKYLKSIGGAFDVMLLMNGVEVPSYNNIPLIVRPWDPILTELNGGDTLTHAAILTLRGNFVYATDKDYAEENPLTGEKYALMVWYEMKDKAAYWDMFLKGGSQIALPEHVCIAITSF